MQPLMSPWDRWVSVSITINCHSLRRLGVGYSFPQPLMILIVKNKWQMLSEILLEVVGPQKMPSTQVRSSSRYYYIFEALWSLGWDREDGD
jgi:hypothetical protein